MEQDDRFVRSRYAPGPERAPAPLFWRPMAHVDRARTPDLHSPVILGPPAPMDRDQVHELFEEFLTKRGQDSALDFLAWVEGHPEHEAELRALWARHVLAEQVIGMALPSGETDVTFYQASVEREEPSGSRLRGGEVVGDFRLIRPVGSGGMGHVWEAEQLSLRRRVAFK